MSIVNWKDIAPELHEMVTRYNILRESEDYGAEHTHLYELFRTFDVTDEDEPERVAQFYKRWKETRWSS